MKKCFSACSAVMLCMLILLTACTKDDSDGDPINPSNTIIKGNWTISNFRQRTEDKTSQYAGYTFAFSTAGSLIATKGTSTTTGSWTYSSASGSSYMGIFTISIGNDDPLKRLNESWLVDAGQSNPGQLKLTHPEAAEDEHVTFTK